LNASVHLSQNCS